MKANQRQEQQDIDKQIAQLRTKQKIKGLDEAEGHGTSMVSLQSVQSAIKSTQQRLKRYNHNTFPANGLAIFCGLAEVGQEKERLVTVDVEPMRPIKSFVYLCNKRFNTDMLKSLSVDENEDLYGFVIIDGKGALLGLLQGTSRQVLHTISVDLPNKTRRGGQSALRFDRIRSEKRGIYIGKVAQLAIDNFLVENRPKVKGIVLAGQAGCKDELYNHKLFHKHLRPLVMQSLDLAYGGEVGFDAAIDQSAAALGSAKLLQEKHLLERHQEEMSRDTGKHCSSVQDTLAALDMGAVEDLIVWDGLEMIRCDMANKETGEETVVFLSRDKKEPKSEKMELIQKESLVDWICDNHKSFGCRLTLVSDRTTAGKLFAQGLGGIGGLLRWRVDFHEFQEVGEEDYNTENGGDDDYSFGESSAEGGSGGELDDGDFAF